MDYQLSLLLYSLLIAIPFAYLFLKRTLERKFQTGVVESLADNKAPAQTTTSIMQAPSDNLAPPKDDPFTVEQLKQYDGSDPSKPIYVAIKGAWHHFTHALTHLLRRHHFRRN